MTAAPGTFADFDRAIRETLGERINDVLVWALDHTSALAGLLTYQPPTTLEQVADAEEFIQEADPGGLPERCGACTRRMPMIQRDLKWHPSANHRSEEDPALSRAEETRTHLVELVARTGQESWWPNAADPRTLAHFRKRAEAVLDSLAAQGVVSTCSCDRSPVATWAFCAVHGISKAEMADRVNTAESEAWKATRADRAALKEQLARKQGEVERLLDLLAEALDGLSAERIAEIREEVGA